MFLQLTVRRDGWYVGLIALLFTIKLMAPTAHLIIGSADDSKAWLFICSTLGNRSIALDDNGEEPAFTGDHCPLCSLSKQLDSRPAIITDVTLQLLWERSLADRVSSVHLPTTFFHSFSRAPPVLV